MARTPIQRALRTLNVDQLEAMEPSAPWHVIRRPYLAAIQQLLHQRFKTVATIHWGALRNRSLSQEVFPQLPLLQPCFDVSHDLGSHLRGTDSFQGKTGAYFWWELIGLDQSEVFRKYLGSGWVSLVDATKFSFFFSAELPNLLSLHLFILIIADSALLGNG
jgi:hypothetical protein